MKTATRIAVSTMGAIAALAGAEHGVGEILQGNVAPAGIVGSFVSMENSNIMLFLPPFCFATLFLAILTALARDSLYGESTKYRMAR